VSDHEHRQPESTTPPEAPGLDDSRVIAALEEYMAATEDGRPPDRRTFLAKHSDIAGALAECLEGLAALHGAGSSSRRGAAGSRAPVPVAEGAPGMALGDFQIVREVGRGGMGIVYEAEQLSLGRRVALKVLPFAAALDPKQLQRFRNEAQAAAHLHHPHIVPVYFVGAERGVHYYAMQLIDGQNLAAVAAAAAELPKDKGQRTKDKTGSSGTPSPTSRDSAAVTEGGFGARLSTQRSGQAADYFGTVARLTAQAADALEYAHAMGIVHRDVKPANLLLDNHGNLWVTDFGLAQFQANANLTQTGELLGTLRYMSPEQVGGPRGVVDHRTDVYSLGATLYELLTLRPIFEGSGRQTLLFQIMREEPRPPRAIDRAIPEELETIVLKAVSKDPADRYATAGAFAEDLRRFLGNEPILARRPTLKQRARKWGQRHPGVIATALGLLLIVAVGSSVSAGLIRVEQERTKAEQLRAEAGERSARAEQARAEEEKQKARESQQQAEAAEAKATAAAERERQRAEQAEKLLQVAREAVDELIQVSESELVDRPGIEDVRNRLLESALKYYQRFIDESRDDPNARADLAMTRQHVAKILSDLTALQSEGQFRLLDSPDVLSDLRATREQKDRLAHLHSRVDRQLHDWFDRSSRLPEKPKPILGFAEAAAAKEKGARDILTPDQLARLRQIDLQLKEVSAFRDPEVVAVLKLTDAQKERIRTIDGDRFAWTPHRHDEPGKPPRKPDQDRRSSAQKAKEVLEKVLKPEQVAHWKEMTGEPFKGQVFRPGPRPGPPPGQN
jgi:serine/threonine protein kinase